MIDLIKRNKLIIGILLVLMIASIGAELFFLAKVGEVIKAKSYATNIEILIGLFLAKIMLQCGLNFMQPHVAFTLLEEISSEVLQKSLTRSGGIALTDAIRLTTGEVDHVIMGYILPIITLFVDVTLTLSILVFLFIDFDKNVLLLFLIGAIIVAIIFIFISRMQLKFGSTRRSNERERMIALRSLHTLNDELNHMGNRNWFFFGYKTKLHSVATAAKVSNFFQQIPRQFLEVLGLLSIGLLYFFLTSKGSSSAEVIAILGVFIIAAFRIIPSATRILASAQSISYARPAYNGLLEILNVGGSNGGTEKQFCELVSNGQLGYGFEYDSVKTSDRSTRNTIVLHKNKLNIIFGLSGSGKSTLLNSISNEMLSKQIGVSLLPQKSTLFHGSFIDNIFLHDENISIDKIDKKYFDSLLTVLKLTELAERFKNEEFIDEESTNLSGGEARRICLLRHLIRSPEVLLLDEPTTGLSSEAEAEIFALLSQLAKDRTIVVVTHSKLAMEFGDQYISL